MKKVALLQPCYIPWKGYFDIIRSVDEFVLYDDAEYSKGGFLNRNKVQTNDGAKWLTIPVKYKNRSNQKICEVEISDFKWKFKHWKTLKQVYSKSFFWSEYGEYFFHIYRSFEAETLSEINKKFILEICNILKIKTKISSSLDYNLKGDKNSKIIDLCKKTGSQLYLSGPSAKGYIDLNLFNKENIKILWVDYSGYPKYNQLNRPYISQVSILDMIFNLGCNSTDYMRIF